MKYSTLEVFCCPACKANFEIKALVETSNHLHRGLLVCNNCKTATPVCAGFALFTETFSIQTSKATSEYLDTLENNLFGDAFRYETFVRQKSRRPTHDSYAAFQPYNESSRAFLPFVPLLRQILKPGDHILDTWCRTGWSAGFLSGLFPEQNIVSIWEGNAGTLGYRGFRFWYSQYLENNNHDVLFCSLSDPLPFKNEVFGAVHGLDSMHRYRQDVMVPELLRVARQEGAVIFPHVHLANAEPDPYFDRGGTILHGKHYRKYFDELLAKDKRKAFILSEPGAFLIRTPVPLKDDHDTSDYNGLIAIVPEALSGIPLCPEANDARKAGSQNIIANPIYEIDLSFGTIHVGRDRLDGSVGKLLDRHPIYEKYLKDNAISHLTTEQCEVIYWSKKALTVEAIAKKLDTTVQNILEIIEPLIQSDVLQLFHIPQNIARLQYFHSDIVFIPQEGRATVKHLFDDAVKNYSDKPLLISDEDGSAFRYSDAGEVVSSISTRLAQSGLKKGDRVLVYSWIHAEATLLFWAAMQRGIVFVPVDPNIPAAVLNVIVDDVKPKLIFSDVDHFKNCPAPLDAKLLLFDTEVQHDLSEVEFFSDWLNSGEGNILPVEVSPDDTGVILFTSGTTGKPKGVVLTHGALYQSGHLMNEAYEWQSGDVLWSLGELHTMSGLRNPCIATLHSGTAFIVASADVRKNILAIAERISRHHCTLLATVPATIRQFNQFSQRIDSQHLFGLRLILSTGSDLTQTDIDTFEGQFHKPVLNYYGLTETSGICIAVRQHDEEKPKGSLGTSMGCIAQVIDENGKVLGPDQIGELRIYTDNCMKSYYQNEAATVAIIKNGWFYTGDLAKIDAHGQIFLSGRKKDLIKDRFGEIIYPSEVEECLISHPEVADACVCPFTGKTAEEKLVAFIVPAQLGVNEDKLIKELHAFVSAQIGRRKVPHTFQLVAQLPRNSNGKVQKKQLLENMDKETEQI